jgi:hypothetical protein
MKESNNIACFFLKETCQKWLIAPKSKHCWWEHVFDIWEKEDILDWEWLLTHFDILTWESFAL